MHRDKLSCDNNISWGDFGEEVSPKCPNFSKIYLKAKSLKVPKYQVKLKFSKTNKLHYVNSYNPKVVSSNLTPATKIISNSLRLLVKYKDFTNFE